MVKSLNRQSINGQPRLDFFKRVAREQQFVGTQHVVSVERIARRQCNFFKVARGERQILVNAGGNDRASCLSIPARKSRRGNPSSSTRTASSRPRRPRHRLEPFAQRLSQGERAGILGNFLVKSRGFGPKTTPPPAHNGERNEPARARPVPFCFHGFLLEPWTSPDVLVQAVPLRCAALWATPRHGRPACPCRLQ
jgi:hypothetical protein